ncbi:fusaric acid resistance family protein [Kitasatospora cineracea]|uniref:Fusaric acid resistance family protein n=1 Tax=Kitasatospora cineracea TaxID=88074 RepID=A0A3N4RDS9_9ACTN|nr:fusaric acid resistance family protein [Kitasatospora cineracea]
MCRMSTLRHGRHRTLRSDLPLPRARRPKPGPEPAAAPSRFRRESGRTLRWVRQTCAPKGRPAVSPAVWRSALAVTAPAGVGLGLGRPAEGVMVAMGALSAVLTDVAAAYRHRAITMLLPQLLGAAGAFAMLAAQGRWFAPGVLPALGVVAGVLAALGVEGSLGAMILLMDAEVAMDLPLPGPLWWPPALMLLGGLSVVGLALAGRPFFRGRAERALLAQCLAGCAAVLAPDAAGPAGTARRRALHDVLERARHTGSVGGSVLLARHLPGLLALAEAASSAGARGLVADPALVDRLRAEAGRVAAGRPGAGGAWPPGHGPLDVRLVRAARAAVAPGPGPVGSAGLRAGLRAGLSPGRRRAAVRAVLADPRSWLGGLRVGAALLLAGAAAAHWDLRHPYWAVLNVTFVCRPEVGPVTGRALERFCGTALGLLGSGLVLACAGPDGALLAVLALAAGLVPALSGTGYLYQAAALATVVLMATQLAGDPGLPLLLPNLASCAIGCLAAVLAGELFGPRHRHPAVARRLAGAVEQAALALTPHRPRTAAPAPYRPGAAVSAAATVPHLQLAAARAEFERVRREPPWRQGATARWAALIDEVERTVDTALAPAAPADHRHFDATRHHLHRLATDLHRLAARP